MQIQSLEPRLLVPDLSNFGCEAPDQKKLELLKETEKVKNPGEK